MSFRCLVLCEICVFFKKRNTYLDTLLFFIYLPLVSVLNKEMSMLSAQSECAFHLKICHLYCIWRYIGEKPQQMFGD